MQVFPGEGLILFLSRSKTDRTSLGREYRVPALSQLCPVAAYRDWLALSGLTEGPVFRSIDCWGHLSMSALNPQSIVPMLRSLLVSAGCTGCPPVQQSFVAPWVCQLGRHQLLGCAGPDGICGLEGHQVGDALDRASRFVCPRADRGRATALPWRRMRMATVRAMVIIIRSKCWHLLQLCGHWGCLSASLCQLKRHP